MQTENWKKVKGLLNEVLPLDTAQREKFFEKSKIGGEIRQEVKSLLLFEKESEDLMHLSAVEFLKDLLIPMMKTVCSVKTSAFINCPRTRLRRNGRGLSRGTRRREI